MAITREEVEHVARLARLELTDEEIETFRGQLDAVLERAQRIQALDLDGVPPTAHPIAMQNVWREDEVVSAEERGFDPKAVLDNAPASEDGKFRVPQILEDTE